MGGPENGVWRGIETAGTARAWFSGITLRCAPRTPGAAFHGVWVAVLLFVMLGLSVQVTGQMMAPVKSPPRSPNFYSAQALDQGVLLPPLPGNPLPELKVYPLGDGDFVYDDFGFDYDHYREETRMEAALNGMFLDRLAAPLAPTYGPNDHWLTIHDVGWVAGDTEDYCWSSTVFLKAWSPEPCQP